MCGTRLQIANHLDRRWKAVQSSARSRPVERWIQALNRPWALPITTNKETT